MPVVNNHIQQRGDVVTVNNPDGSVRVGIVLGHQNCRTRDAPVITHTVLVGLDQMTVFRFEGAPFTQVFW